MDMNNGLPGLPVEPAINRGLLLTLGVQLRKAFEDPALVSMPREMQDLSDILARRPNPAPCVAPHA